MQINNSSIDAGNPLFYNKAFMDTIEAHMSYFRNSSKTSLVDVNSNKASIYKGDFYGFLLDFKIDPEYHWIIMRTNYMTSPTEFDLSVTSLLIPNQNEIDQIKAIHDTTRLVYM